MIDQEQLTFLLKVLKQYAEQKHCYERDKFMMFMMRAGDLVRLWNKQKNMLQFILLELCCNKLMNLFYTLE